MGTVMQKNPQYGYYVPGSHPLPYGCGLANGSLAIHYHSLGTQEQTVYD